MTAWLAARMTALAAGQVVWSWSRSLIRLQSGGCLRIVTGVDLRFIPDGTARPAACQPPEVFRRFLRGPPAPPSARDPDRHGGTVSSLRTRDTHTSTASPSSRAGVALAIMLSAQLMIILDATVVNIALPHIQTSLRFSSTSLSWVMNGYTLTFGGLLLLG